MALVKYVLIQAAYHDHKLMWSDETMTTLGLLCVQVANYEAKRGMKEAAPAEIRKPLEEREEEPDSEDLGVLGPTLIIWYH